MEFILSLKKMIVIVLFTMSLSFSLMAEISITLVKSDHSNWSVTYTSSEPIRQLEFKRTPDSSRQDRWQLPPDFLINSEDGTEYIRKNDGTLFTQITALLTPAYVSLVGDYAPFSPFSDGGMLVHSGRFFVCKEKCSTSDSVWTMRLEAPPTDFILVDGEYYQEIVEWEDKHSGKQLYIGPQNPSPNMGQLKILDPSLPLVLQELIVSSFDKFSQFYDNHLPKPLGTLQFFASRSQSTNGRYGYQGGVLPNQIFMHWYGRISDIDSDTILKFLAHETAHHYQQAYAFSQNPIESWIHEGSAELFALLALHERKNIYVDSLKHAALSCLNHLPENSSFPTAVKYNFQLHYSCGLVLFDLMHNDLLKAGADIFTLWSAYDKALRNQKPASAKTFTEVAENLLNPELHSLLRGFLNEENLDARNHFLVLLTNFHSPYLNLVDVMQLLSGLEKHQD